MATFASRKPSGEAVYHAMTESRARVHFDRSALRLLRARTCAAYQAMQLSVADIASVFNLNESTVYADLAWLRVQRAAGLDRLPTDPHRDESGSGDAA